MSNAELSPTTGDAAQRQFPCKHCGANLQFAPGTTSLNCPYCGTMNEIAPESPGGVQELDFTKYFDACCDESQMTEQVTVKCTTCGAETTLAPNVTADRCPFCGSGIVAEGASKKIIKPQSLLPFQISQKQAGESFQQWIASRWFAPSELTRRAEASQIAGVYVPYWTYDAYTTSNYTGERGDDYIDTETYTTTENGQLVTRTREITRTRWYPVTGSVNDIFNELLILASRSLPQKYAEALEPWDLKDLTPYRDEYLSGFVAQSYQIGLPEGFEQAKQIMAVKIQDSVRYDMGGDHQRDMSIDTHYHNVSFKHCLLPIWISAYRYGGKTFHFLVNARTGEVQGERPFSVGKIMLLIAGILAAIAIIAVLAQSR